MYQQLGFSLKPPAWLRNIVGNAIKSTVLTVPTPAGVPITVDLGNPASLDAAKKALLGTKVGARIGTQPPNPLQQVNAGVQNNIPGGWLTIAAVAGGAFLLLRRGRR